MKSVVGSIYSYIKRTDRLLWLLCFVLTATGLVLLSGILDTGYTGDLRISQRNTIKQVLASFIGISGAVVISIIDYKDLAKLWRLHVPVCYLLIFLTFFIGVGSPDRPEDKRWLIVPILNFNLQPAELLRISFILVFAYHISKVRESLNHPLSVLGLLAHGAAPVLIVHFQGDDGSALILAAIIVCMLFGAGISWKYIAAAIVAVCASVPVLWNYILDDFQKRRIIALYNQSPDDLQGVLFQQNRAIIAFAMGGRGGTGVFGASHVYVPEMHNDFIFSFLGESAGFVGVLTAIAVMVVLWFKILINAGRAKDALGYLICLGVFSMLSFQSIINIGMNVSLLPAIGNPLPFISYGGSSLMTSYFGIGMVLSVAMHASKSMFDTDSN